MLASGSRIGSYEILAQLGIGGMGEVYRARDTKLGREVAIKVLPDVFACDPDRLARFQREAQVLAALNHPNIAAIYGLDDDGKTKALILELVPGDTLADRIARGPIPLDEALPIAKQIAEALEAAHEQGIIHRDLKPANIKVTADGVVKVLDFGLAKLIAPATAVDAPVSPLSMSPTLTSPAMMTGVGVLLGTAAYMSPEQAKGRDADKRSDVWAFGCVLYELLTARKTYAAPDVAETLAAVLTRTPDWSAVGTAPTSVQALLRRCLERDPRRRLRDIGEARIVLDDSMAAPVSAAQPQVPDGAGARRRPWLPWAVAFALMVATGLALWKWPQRPGVAAPTLRLFAELGDGLALTTTYGAPFDISPDGTRLAFVGTASDGLSHLYLRDLAAAVPRLLPGTDDARDIFFSTDGFWIGFVAGGRIRKISTAGGAPIELVNVSNDSPRGAWADDGSIFFSLAGPGNGIRRIGIDGKVTLVTTVARKAGEINHRLPHPLPGSRGVLFTASVGSYSQTNVMVQPLPTGVAKVVVTDASSARFVPPDRLLYEQHGALYAAPFSLASLEVTGSARQILDHVDNSNFGGAVFRVAATGTVAVIPVAINLGRRYVIDWMDAAGTFEPLIDRQDNYVSMQFSPDGNTLAVDPLDGPNDVWLHDLSRSVRSRLTSDLAEDRNPVWSPDGRYVAFASQRDGSMSNLWVARADQTGEPARLTTCDCTQLPTSWDPTGHYLAFTQNWPPSNEGPKPTRNDVYILPVEESAAAAAAAIVPGTPQALIDSPFQEGEAVFSRDGHWIAYESDDSGAREVYVRPFPGAGPRVQISPSGGAFPAWAPDQHRMFYLGADDRIWVVDFAIANGTLRPEKAKRWSDPVLEERVAPRGRIFAVPPAGKRIAVLRRPSSTPQVTKILIVTNALASLEAAGGH
jgi:Tol biopolymer transport system component